MRSSSVEQAELAYKEASDSPTSKKYRNWRNYLILYKIYLQDVYLHFSTGQYKNCSWSTNLPVEHSLCEGSRCYPVR
jgi:hypothetical protein